MQENPIKWLSTKVEIPQAVLEHALRMQEENLSHAKILGMKSMVETKEFISPSDFSLDTWEELFDHIIEDKINGNRTQSKELFNSLNDRKKSDFIDYVSEMHNYQQYELVNTIKFYTL
jgi:hypothetical protein